MPNVPRTSQARGPILTYKHVPIGFTSCFGTLSAMKSLCSRRVVSDPDGGTSDNGASKPQHSARRIRRCGVSQRHFVRADSMSPKGRPLEGGPVPFGRMPGAVVAPSSSQPTSSCGP